MHALAAHVAERHDVTVARVVRLDEDVYRIDGPSWVARCYPSGSRDAAEATAELLRRLAPTPFPAERLAPVEAVSVCEGRPVLLTEFVAGSRAPGNRRTFATLGGLLGALHAHAGTTLPPGGGWHHLVAQGDPADEITAALALLDRVERRRRRASNRRRGTAPARRLRRSAARHRPPGLRPVNVVNSADGPVIVDWAGAGRGPRLWSLGFLLWAAGVHDPALVDAVISRYRRHVDLSADELERLPAAIRARPLTLDCWSAAHGRTEWATAVQRLDRTEDGAEQIADRARAAVTM